MNHNQTSTTTVRKNGSIHSNMVMVLEAQPGPMAREWAAQAEAKAQAKAQEKPLEPTPQWAIHLGASVIWFVAGACCLAVVPVIGFFGLVICDLVATYYLFYSFGGYVKSKFKKGQ